ncbi:MAG: carbohydrate ABC transporter substrate-binding protein, partial [Mycetocola sp.]
MTRHFPARAAIGSLAVAAALVLSSCSTGGTGSTGDYNPDEDITLEISWWGDDTRAALFGEVIQNFEDANPNITVTATPVGAPD